MIARASLLRRFLFPKTLAQLRGIRASSRIRLSPDDLDLATTACRALAQHYREDAKRFDDTSLRESALQRAKHTERVADFFERQRDRA